MHDTHCHLDLYKDPLSIATSAERSGIFTIAVTNLPSAYYAAKPHMGGFRHLKLALGLHPLLATHHTRQEKRLFRRAATETDYIGEVGLDLSQKGADTKVKQITSFRFVLDLLRGQHKIITVHSRRAEFTALKLLAEFDIGPVIFHWYSGPLTVLDQVVEKGHYFSINSAMINSNNGQRVATRIPRDHLLTETDGPFVTLEKRPAIPADVSLVHEFLSQHWQEPTAHVADRLSHNLIDYIERATT